MPDEPELPTRNLAMFELPYEHRPYVCTLCGKPQMIGTNHTDVCFSHCPGCSWKGMQDETGEWHLPGYRAFRYEPSDPQAEKLAGLDMIESADKLLEAPPGWKRRRKLPPPKAAQSFSSWT